MVNPVRITPFPAHITVGEEEKMAVCDVIYAFEKVSESRDLLEYNDRLLDFIVSNELLK